MRLDLNYFMFYAELMEPHRIRIKLFTAPGYAEELRKALQGMGIECWDQKHDVVVFTTVKGVVGILRRMNPTTGLEQALEELERADKDIVMGLRATPEQLGRRAQAIRAVLALLPAVRPIRKHGWGRRK